MFRLLAANAFVFTMYFLTPTPAHDLASATIRYRYFDDYLTHLDGRDQVFITGDAPELEGSGEAMPEPAEEIGSLLSRPLPIRTGSLRSKEVTCCMLGQLAGDKGYHCFVKFYAARIMNRNYNRAHNKKIAGLQPRYQGTSAKRSSDKLMRTFQQCVTTQRGVIFHKCCHLSAMENSDSYGKSKFANKVSKNH